MCSCEEVDGGWEDAGADAGGEAVEDRAALGEAAEDAEETEVTGEHPVNKNTDKQNEANIWF